MSLAKSFKRDIRIDASIAQIAQRLPQRGATAGALFDAGEGLRARSARANDLPERFFEKEITAQLQRHAAVLFLKTQGELVKTQELNIEQR